MTSRSRLRPKGDGTDDYGRFTKTTLIRKLAEANQRNRDLQNVAHHADKPLRDQLARTDLDLQNTQRRLDEALKRETLAAVGREEALSELAAIRAPRPLSDAELVALAAEVMALAEKMPSTPARRALNEELARRGVLERYRVTSATVGPTFAMRPDGFMEKP